MASTQLYSLLTQLSYQGGKSSSLCFFLSLMATSASQEEGCLGCVLVKNEDPCHHSVYWSCTEQDATGDIGVALLQGNVNVSEIGKGSGPAEGNDSEQLWWASPLQHAPVAGPGLFSLLLASLSVQFFFPSTDVNP